MPTFRSLIPPIDDPRLAEFVPFAGTVDDVLAARECAALVARIEALGPETALINRGARQELDTRIRDNDRVIFDDHALAEQLFWPLASVVPATWKTGARVVGLNERFRGYRYQPGQRFAPHYDGAFARDRDEASEITVLVYLNDCTGGETAFLDYDLEVKPRPGMALLFQHAMLHEGRPVSRGLKYVLRTDVMYRR